MDQRSATGKVAHAIHYDFFVVAIRVVGLDEAVFMAPRSGLCEAMVGKIGSHVVWQWTMLKPGDYRSERVWNLA